MRCDVLTRWLFAADETLAELFARHPSKGSFEGNPNDRFRAVVDGVAYGPSRTPGALGLYGGRYTVEFRPGESQGTEFSCCGAS